MPFMRVSLRRFRRAAPLLSLVAFAAASLTASVTTSLGAQACRDCASDDTVHQTHVTPAFGLRVGAPQKASIALGAVVGETWQTKHHDHSRNVALFVEPGLAAGRVSAAYIDKGYGNFGSGFAIAATALRTWDDPWWGRQNTTYAGGEITLWPIVFVGPRIGLFRALDAPANFAKRWMITFDFGFGL
jgi:hypothetical protein